MNKGLRRLLLFNAFCAFLLGCWCLASGAGYPLTDAILQGRAWIFSPPQTFLGGIKTPLTLPYDGSLSAPLIAPSVATSGASGSCASGNTYEMGILWVGKTGVTQIGPLSAPIVPSPSSRKITVTLNETPPSAATAFGVVYAKASDGYSTKRLCTNPISTDPANYTAASNPSFDCTCSAAGAVFTNTNTTGTKTNLSVDSSVVFKVPQAGASPMLFWTENKNQLDWSLAGPRLSSDSGATFSYVPVYGKNVRYVCSTGCAFATIATALTDIADAASNNLYTVFVGSYSSSESITAKSYVSIVGISPDQSVLQKVTIPADVTGVVLRNLSINSTGIATTAPILLQAGATGRSSVVIDNCIVGTAGASDDGIYDQGSQHDFLIRNTLFLGRWDTVVWGPYDTELGINNRWILNDSGNTNTLTAHNWVFNPTQGVTVREYNMDVDATVTTSTGSATPIANIGDGSGSPTGGTTAYYYGGTIRIHLQSTSGTPLGICASLPSAATTSFSSAVRFYGVSCAIDAAGAVGTLTGVSVSSTSGHSTWTAAWQGGEINLSGGANRYSVDNADSASAFSFDFVNVRHNGTFHGTGKTYAMTDIPGAACPSTCKTGTMCVNTSPALCFCGATDTYTKISGSGSCP